MQEGVFSNSYDESRNLFLKAATAKKAALYTCIHPEQKGPDGGRLAIDLAVIGAADAENLLLSISGTHGQEGFAGAAAQLQHIRDFDVDRLSPSTALAYIHGANPYGFAHISRTTENNVDLNRNFIDHAAHPEISPIQHELQEIFALQSVAAKDIQGAIDRLGAVIQRDGADIVINAATKGQYAIADGLNYGGRRAEWSNVTLRALVRGHFASAKKVALIDWHVGLGDYGEPYFLCFNDPQSDLFERAAAWWGDKAVRTESGFSGGAARPDYSGLLVEGLAEAFPHDAEIVRAVIEFGTYDNMKMLTALLRDRWLRFDGAQAPADVRRDVTREMLEIFNPADKGWRDSVLHVAAGIYEKTFDGLVSWRNDKKANKSNNREG